jgi:hypothetical protein
MRRIIAIGCTTLFALGLAAVASAETQSDVREAS